MSQKDKGSTTSALALALKKGSNPKKKEFDTIMHWVKQILGLIIGASFGVFKLQGVLFFVLGIAAFSLIALLYSKNYLEVDEDDIENTEIITSAFMNGLFSFLVSFCSCFFEF